jgi:hypothetical protein
MATTGGEVKRRLTLFGLPNSTKLRHRFGVRTGFEPVQQNLQLGELEPNFRFKFSKFTEPEPELSVQFSSVRVRTAKSNRTCPSLEASTDPMMLGAATADIRSRLTELKKPMLWMEK